MTISRDARSMMRVKQNPDFESRERKIASRAYLIVSMPLMGVFTSGIFPKIRT